MPKWMLIALMYAVPFFTILIFYYYLRQRHHKQSSEALTAAVSDGLTEPASLHPVIDPLACTGCGSCVSACPEKNVLGMIDRHAHLINPTNCIGHGACANACPQDAIKLVFGSATRGVEIPEVSPQFETNVPGIFIAGELGGMGLIRNAIEQGRQAMDSIKNYLQSPLKTKRDLPGSKILDCIIIGGGPAGLSATLGAKVYQLKSITIDQDQAGGTVAHFPRGKIVMTQPAQMPLVGKVRFGEVKKEALMQFWLNVIKEHAIQIQQNETLLSVETLPDGLFNVNTSKQSYFTRSVLLAIGRRGTPRKLGVPGEESTKVVYRLIDAEQYRGQSVLVVGGGDSALEAACSIAELGDTQVALSYRNDSFNRAKAKNRQWVERLQQAKRLTVYFSSQVIEIKSSQVNLDHQGKSVTLDNDAVIVCAGGILPTALLKTIGIRVATKYGEA